METATANDHLFVKMVLTAWDKQNKSLIDLTNQLGPERLAEETSPGKNSGHYLLGHLVAINDAMLPLLGFGQLLYPELEHIFIKSPDKSGLSKTPVEELKMALSTINEALNENFARASTEEWFGRHTVVSAEDFAKEPTRNKLNVVITRLTHMAYHLGQISLLKK